MRSPPTARIRRATGRIIPQKTARIIRMESLRTPHPPLFNDVRVQRGQLIPVALLSSDLWARFYAPIQLRLGPMTASLNLSDFVARHISRRRDVSPHRDRAERLQRRAPPRYLLMPM